MVSDNGSAVTVRCREQIETKFSLGFPFEYAWNYFVNSNFKNVQKKNVDFKWNQCWF